MLDSRRLRRTLDRLAYASLVLDICIAIITALSILGVNEGQHFLLPVNYLLTVVVALSLILLAVLFLFKAKEKLV